MKLWPLVMCWKQNIGCPWRPMICERRPLCRLIRFRRWALLALVSVVPCSRTFWWVPMIWARAPGSWSPARTKCWAVIAGQSTRLWRDWRNVWVIRDEFVYWKASARLLRSRSIIQTASSQSFCTFYWRKYTWSLKLNELEINLSSLLFSGPRRLWISCPSMRIMSIIMLRMWGIPVRVVSGFSKSVIAVCCNTLANFITIWTNWCHSQIKSKWNQSKHSFYYLHQVIK